MFCIKNSTFQWVYSNNSNIAIGEFIQPCLGHHNNILAVLWQKID